MMREDSEEEKDPGGKNVRSEKGEERGGMRLRREESEVGGEPGWRKAGRLREKREVKEGGQMRAMSDEGLNIPAKG